MRQESSDGINGYRTTSINDSIKPTKEDLIILAIKTGLNKKEADVVFEEMKDKRISGFEYQVLIKHPIKFVLISEIRGLMVFVIRARLANKESTKKFYFIDNGLLNLFLFRNETSLLENMVAIELVRRYGKDNAMSNHYF